MSGDNLTRAKEVGWRQALAEVLAEKFSAGIVEGGMWVSWLREDGGTSAAAVSPQDAVETIAPIITDLLEDQGRVAYQRGQSDMAREIYGDIMRSDRQIKVGGEWMTHTAARKAARIILAKADEIDAEIARGQQQAGQQR